MGPNRSLTEPKFDTRASIKDRDDVSEESGQGFAKTSDQQEPIYEDTQETVRVAFSIFALVNRGFFLIVVQNQVPFPTGGACCSWIGSRAWGLPGWVYLGNVTNIEELSTPLFTKDLLADQSSSISLVVLVLCFFPNHI